MTDYSPIPPELIKRLNEVIEPLFAQHHRSKCYLGSIFRQGKRRMVQINVPAHDLPILLQAKPSMDNNPDSGKNRPEVKGHAEEVKQYIVQRIKKNKPWILGTLTANVDPEKIKVFELSRGLCFIAIPRGVKLDITDGQHRKRAIHELVESAAGELIGDNDFPITLVLENDFKQCQTDFKDMAQTRPLDRSLLLSFGEFEGQVGITKQLQEVVKMFQHKTEQVKNSPSTKKKLIYTTNYIARFVSCAFTNDPSNDLEDYDVEQSSQVLAESLNFFFSSCPHTQKIANSHFDDLTIEDIVEFKENCVLGRSVGLEVLGRLFNRTYDRYNQQFIPEKIAKLAQLDWSRSSYLWEGNIIVYQHNPSNPAKSYKVSTTSSAVRVAVDKAATASEFNQNSSDSDSGSSWL